MPCSRVHVFVWLLLKSIWVRRCTMLDSFLSHLPLSLVKEGDSGLSNAQDEQVLSPYRTPPPSHSAIQTLAAIPELNHVANGCVHMHTLHTPLILLFYSQHFPSGTTQITWPQLSSLHVFLCPSVNNTHPYWASSASTIANLPLNISVSVFQSV